MESIGKNYQSAWLGEKGAEWLFILLVPILTSLSVILFEDYFENQTEVNSLWWIILIMGVDVSHVYSTLYRTYFDSKEFNANRILYTYTPAICLVLMIVFYQIHPMAFWRCLAYLAVFHFIRQQYGFMRLYARNEPQNGLNRYLSTAVIYAVVLYPIIFWHLQPGRTFSWFVSGDFLIGSQPIILSICFYLYLSILLSYSLYTTYIIIYHRQFNLPKNLIILGSAISWYIGIVAYNGDLIFTLLNVVSHGIPYMALIWIYGKKQHKNSKERSISFMFKNVAIPIFIGLLILFAYVEEGLWDALVWRDHPEFFELFSSLPQQTHATLLSIIVPLLSLPQVTHYVLDAFIWKVRKMEV